MSIQIMKIRVPVEISEIFHHWGKYNLMVIGDGMLADGTRIHIVKEEGYDGDLLDNALVYSEGVLQCD